MMLMLALIAIAWTVSIAPRLIVEAIATMIGVALVIRSRRTERDLLRAGAVHRGLLDFDRKLTRSERRLMRRSLRLALDRTELRSLFPTVMARAEAIADRWLVPGLQS